jgi:hypothetical protein
MEALTKAMEVSPAVNRHEIFWARTGSWFGVSDHPLGCLNRKQKKALAVWLAGAYARSDSFELQQLSSPQRDDEPVLSVLKSWHEWIKEVDRPGEDADSIEASATKFLESQHALHRKAARSLFWRSYK